MRRPKKPKFEIGELVQLTNFLNLENDVVVYPLKSGTALKGQTLVAAHQGLFVSPLDSIIEQEHLSGFSKPSNTIAMVLGLPFRVDYGDLYLPYNWFPILVDSKVCIANEGIINKVLAVE